jgi:hypothetical protein
VATSVIRDGVYRRISTEASTETVCASKNLTERKSAVEKDIENRMSGAGDDRDHL